MTPTISTLTRTDRLVVDKLRVVYPVRGRQLVALDGVSLAVEPGETLGIVGESGCGKSTLARVIAGLTTATEGSVRLGDEPLTRRRNRAQSRRIQMVFQDPASSLNPRMTVGSMLAEILRVHRIVPRSAIPNRLQDLMHRVELPPSLLQERPRSLSGGQRQRVAIARALSLEPDILVLDEAVASLDVSVQASVLTLLRSLRDDLNVSMVFISHDLGAVRGLCSRVAVTYLGRIVEIGPTAEVLARPRHPYTQALIAAEPDLDQPKRPGAAELRGEAPSPIDLPDGCAFQARCPRAQDTCASTIPPIDTSSAHDQACFFPLNDDRKSDNGGAEVS